VLVSPLYYKPSVNTRTVAFSRSWNDEQAEPYTSDMAIASLRNIPLANRREYWRARRRVRRARRSEQEVTVDESAFGARRGVAAASHRGALSLSPSKMRVLRGDCCAMRHRHGADSFFLPLSDALALLSTARAGAETQPAVPAMLLYVAQLLIAELDAHEAVTGTQLGAEPELDSWTGLWAEALQRPAEGATSRVHRKSSELQNAPSLPPLNRSTSGAEFWVQRRSQGEPINWHWDKDEQVRLGRNNLSLTTRVLLFAVDMILTLPLTATLVSCGTRRV